MNICVFIKYQLMGRKQPFWRIVYYLINQVKKLLKNTMENNTNVILKENKSLG